MKEHVFLLEDEVKEVMRQYDEFWKEKARAAGWSEPVPSKLRVVEPCYRCNGDKTIFTGTIGRDAKCRTCHGTGTIKRKLTPEEMNETAEDLAREYFTVHDTDFLTLPSGLKVILEENDANL